MRRKQDQVRQRIVEAAYESFWRSGFTRTSVDGIAARAKLTKRTVYSYFRSKDDLLAAVLQHYTELAGTRLLHIQDKFPTDRDGVIDSFFRQLAGWARRTPRWSGSGLTRLVVELPTCLATRLEPSPEGQRRQRRYGWPNDSGTRGFRNRPPERATLCY